MRLPLSVRGGSIKSHMPIKNGSDADWLTTGASSKEAIASHTPSAVAARSQL
jgi:hypothetical protein